MRLHLLEHEPFDIRRSNFSIWAENKGYYVESTDVFKGVELPSPKDFDWLIVLGGFQHAWQEQKHSWLKSEKALISEALATDKIVLGICFGAQLLAEVLGGRVFSNEKEEIGWYEVTVSEAGIDSFFFKNVPRKFLTFHWHSDHFTLAPGCTRLAFSKPTANQAFIANNARAVGLQFHPEYTIEMVRHFAVKYGHEWQKGQYVAGKQAVLSQCEELPETYWLMELLLENMERHYQKIEVRQQRSEI